MSIKENRQNYILDKRVNYPQGIMTRREWLKMMMVQGATVTESTNPRVRYSRTKFNRMDYAEQREYMKKCEEVVPCYELRVIGEDGYWEITKTEYEYFQNIQLSQELNNKKMDVHEKIEAGIATKEEIAELTESDNEYFTKYATN